MTTPHEQLDQLIHDLQHNQPVSPQTEEETLTAELVQLAGQFDLHSEFDDALLAQFKPSPSTHGRIPKRVLRWVATFVIGIVGVMMLFTTVPALRVLAEDIIAEIFPRKNDTLWVIAKADDTLIFDGDAIEGFTSLAELQAAIDFELRLPDLSATEYVFSHGSWTVPRNTVQTNYSLYSDASNRPMLRIKQQPLADTVNGTFYASSEQDMISPEAETSPVLINGYHGEIVKGSWTTSPPRNETVYYSWSNHFPMVRLRWKDDVYLYELKLISTDSTVVEELIMLAESMMNQ